MDFLFEGGWGHNQIGSVNKELPASVPDGKFYEWNYSRVYLSSGSGAAHGGARTPAALRRAGGPSAVFVKTDRATQGNWKGVYGAASRTDWAVTWAGSTLDVRAPQKAATGAVLDTQDLNAYNNGTYLVWNIRGHVIFRVKVTSHWTNPALSKIFFDPAHKGQ